MSPSPIRISLLEFFVAWVLFTKCATVVVVVAATKVGAGTRSSINSNHGLPMAPLAPKVVGNISLIPPEVTTSSSNPHPPNGPTILHGTIGPNPSHCPHGSLSTTIDPRLLASWAPHAAPRTTLPNTLTQIVPTSSMALKLFLHLWGPYKDGLHLLSFPSASLVKHAFASIDSTAWHRRLEKTNLSIVPLNVCSLAAILNIKAIAATGHHMRLRPTQDICHVWQLHHSTSFQHLHPFTKLLAPLFFHKSSSPHHDTARVLAAQHPLVHMACLFLCQSSPCSIHIPEDITYHLCNLHKHLLVLAPLPITDLASPPPIEPAMPPPAHLMRTSLRNGISQPKNRIEDTNQTWSLVPQSPTHTPVCYKWVICIKHHSDDTIERYKARLVTKGFHNAMALTTLRPSALLSNQPQFTLVSILLFPDNGFYGNSMSKMPSFKNTYIWFICIKHHSDDTIERYKARLVTKGFHNAMALTTLRPSALLSNQPQFTLVSILLFPDDGFYGNSMSKMPSFKNTYIWFNPWFCEPCSSHSSANLTSRTLVLLVTSWALHLNQLKYVHDLLHKSNFLHAKPASIPLAAKFVLTASDVYLLASPTEYHELVLQYFTLTRPDISFAVNTVAQFMSSPHSPYMVAIKRILHYVKGTIDFGLHFTPQGPSTHLIVYSDADWAGCPDSSRSTTGYLICLGSNLISWCSKK
ncbi:unnamed protein product [Prunus armeniaca]